MEKRPQRRRVRRQPIPAVLLALLVGPEVAPLSPAPAVAQETGTAVGATLRFEQEGLDLDTGEVLATPLMALATPGEATAADVWFSYHADRTPHAVLVSDASRGIETAFLDGVPFAYVYETDIPNLTFGLELVDRAFELDDTVVVRTDTSAVFKIGNAVEDETGVSFEYERLDEAVAALRPGGAVSPLAQGNGGVTELAGQPPPGVSSEAWGRILEQIDADSYAVARAPKGESEEGPAIYRARNREQALDIEFAQQGVTFTALGGAETGWEWTMALEGWGYGDALTPLPAPELVASGNRIEYRRGEVVEWYVNEGRGLEQGFDLAGPPAPRGETPKPLTVALGLSGPLVAALAEDGAALLLADAAGETALHYAGLVAWDAAGRILPATMQLADGRLTLEVDDAGAVYPVTIDPTVTHEVKLRPSDLAAGDFFGTSVAMSKTAVVVGAPGADNGGIRSGAAYLFDISGVPLAKLTASDAAAGDRFGSSVAVSETAIVVGAIGDDETGSFSGSAYLYDSSGAPLAKLRASDAAALDQFGNSVAVSETAIVVGAFGDDDSGPSSGAAHLFDTSGASLAKLTASDAAAGDRFGRSVAVSETAVVVGADLDDDTGSDSGAAYLFDISGVPLAKLTPSDAAARDEFGVSVAMSETAIVVGAYGDDDAGFDSGSAYLFDVSGAPLAKLSANDAAAGDRFGVSVAVSETAIVVGAFGDDDAGMTSGSAYLFDLSGTPLAKLTASDAGAFDGFGVSVAVSETGVAAGAWVSDDAGPNSGAAYLFSQEPDPATLILALVDQVESINLQTGIDNSLDAKLDAALQALDDLNENNDVAAANALDAFIQAVGAQAGKQIPQAEADALIAAAQEIVDLLNGT